ncbi:TIGR03084 family metal-binding protein [Actinacidiphila acidipaludis]|uniref:TIGR03084 family protein n=1 Tax=Actinacidiphila acidipaludis TaxID=2873382 RepID=A0ABS7Q746_9ACTN|nr:TIGR03084 family metal-binding protein [Streptomyces acidipaludis]MBY8877847.1 TIGR03084 family protein [Streptomyces acidipaludis]
MADPQSVRSLLDDLRAESDALDSLVAGLPAERWAEATPAEGWTVAHQVAHLAWTDHQALLAIEDPDAFAAELTYAVDHLDTYVDEAAAQGAQMPAATLLEAWRSSRARLWATLVAQPPGVRHPWYGPPMSTAAVANGRLMETWAHGQDIADTLGVRRAPTARLRHVVRIAVRARDYAFAAHGRPAPREEFRWELTAPDGSLWTFGPDGAEQRVTGPALDLCLLAVQRRHRDDLALHAQGEDADAWLSIAQAFAGPPGKGRAAAGPAGSALRPDGGAS